MTRDLKNHNVEFRERLIKNAHALIEEARVLRSHNMFRRALFLQLTAHEQVIKAFKLIIGENTFTSHKKNFEILQALAKLAFQKVQDMLPDLEEKFGEQGKQAGKIIGEEFKRVSSTLDYEKMRSACLYEDQVLQPNHEHMRMYATEDYLKSFEESVLDFIKQLEDLIK